MEESVQPHSRGELPRREVMQTPEEVAAMRDAFASLRGRVRFPVQPSRGCRRGRHDADHRGDSWGCRKAAYLPTASPPSRRNTRHLIRCRCPVPITASRNSYFSPLSRRRDNGGRPGCQSQPPNASRTCQSRRETPSPISSDRLRSGSYHLCDRGGLRNAFEARAYAALAAWRSAAARPHHAAARPPPRCTRRQAACLP
jgi:hypothetical protein